MFVIHFYMWKIEANAAGIDEMTFIVLISVLTIQPKGTIDTHKTDRRALLSRSASPVSPWSFYLSRLPILPLPRPLVLKGDEESLS